MSWLGAAYDDTGLHREDPPPDFEVLYYFGEARSKMNIQPMSSVRDVSVTQSLLPRVQHHSNFFLSFLRAIVQGSSAYHIAARARRTQRERYCFGGMLR